MSTNKPSAEALVLRDAIAGDRLLSQRTAQATALDEFRAAGVDEAWPVLKLSLDAAESKLAKAQAQLAERAVDTARIDHLEALAERAGCGWNVDERKGPYRKHHSQDPSYYNLRDAVDGSIEANSGDENE